MKIDSSLNGYRYPNRGQDLEPKTDDTQQREASKSQRSLYAVTGSDTMLSSSLANALWVMEVDEDSSSDTQMPSLSQDWVETRYQEFA